MHRKQNARNPILFLDFDGVIVVLPDVKNANPECVARLNRIHEVTNCDVVISSSWRYLDGMKRFKAMYGITKPTIAALLAKWGYKGRVIGRTPVGSERNTEDDYCRGAEILQYLREHEVDVPYCILDDDNDMGMLKHMLVQTQGHLGLQDNDVAEVIRKLEPCHYGTI